MSSFLPVCPADASTGTLVNGSNLSALSTLSLSLSSSLSDSTLGLPADSGGDGGGDCTLTLFTTFGFWKLVDGGGWLGRDSSPCN